MKNLKFESLKDVIFEPMADDQITKIYGGYSITLNTVTVHAKSGTTTDDGNDSYAGE